MNVFTKHQSKALILSIILHLSLLLVLLGFNKSVISPPNILMVDFTLKPESSRSMAIVTASRPASFKEVEEQRPIYENNTKNESVLYDQGTVEEITSQSSEQTAALDHALSEMAYKDDNEVSDNAPFSNHENAAPSSLSHEINTDISAKNISPVLQQHPISGTQSHYMMNNFTYIRDMIQRKLMYPKIAREMGWEGKVAVSFFIASNGLAREIKIATSSGKESLDKNALMAVQKASPFPKPPVEAYIKIPIVYRLH